MTGAFPPPPGPGGAAGLPATGQPPAPGIGGAGGAGAAALGAAGAAGALSGERDREHKGQNYGKDADVDGTPLHDLDVGEIPDADRAHNAERIEPDERPDRPHFLHEAAPRSGEEQRVRTHGIDDVDLFADDRLVAPEVIDSAPQDEPGSAGSSAGAAYGDDPAAEDGRS